MFPHPDDLCAIGRLIELEVDSQSHRGILSPGVWAFLWWSAYCALFLSGCFVLHGWTLIALSGLDSISKKVSTAFRYLIIFVAILSVIIAIINGVSDSKIPVPFGLTATFITLLIVVTVICDLTFLVLGVKVILLVRKSLTAKTEHRMLQRVTIMLIGVTLGILTYIVLIFIRAIHVILYFETPYSMSLGLDVMWDVCGALIVTMIVIAFKIHGFHLPRSLFHKSSPSASHTDSHTGGNTTEGHSKGIDSQKVDSIIMDLSTPASRDRAEEATVSM